LNNIINGRIDEYVSDYKNNNEIIELKETVRPTYRCALKQCLGL